MIKKWGSTILTFVYKASHEFVLPHTFKSTNLKICALYKTLRKFYKKILKTGDEIYEK